MSSHDNPPRVAEWLVRRATARSPFASTILGDLREGFVLRAKSATVPARHWYWRQAISLGYRFLLEEFRYPWFARELKHAARRLARAPLFTLTVVLALAIGIGANTAALGIIDGFFIRPLPVPAPNEIVGMYVGDAREPAGRALNAGWASVGAFHFLQERVRGLQSITAYRMTFVSAPQVDRPLWTAVVYGDYFPALGVAPQRGRFIRDDENRFGESRVVVLSDRLWRDYFDADDAVVGRVLRIDDANFTIVGVAPPGFTGIHPEGSTDLWLPAGALAALGTPAAQAADSSRTSVLMFGRLANGGSLATVQTSLDVAARDLGRAYPRQYAHLAIYARSRSRLTSFDTSPQAARLMILAWIMIALLHLAICTSVANLMLARTAARAREMGIRRCLGASRTAILGEVVLEALLIAVMSCAAGLFLSERLMRAVTSMQFMSAFQPHVDARLVLFTVVVAAATVVQFAVLPALETMRADPLTVLRGSRTGRGPRLGRRSELVVVVQTAIAVVLIVDTTLFLGLSYREAHSDPGYDAAHAIVVRATDLPTRRRRADERVLLADVERKLAALPGVQHVALAAGAPLVAGGSTAEVRRTGARPADIGAQTSTLPVGAGYFTAIGAPLIRGRELTSEDRAGVVVVNEALARRQFQSAEVLGELLEVRGAPAVIVGVVRNIADVSTAAEVPRVYVPVDESTERLMIVARTTAPANEVLPMIERALASTARRNVLTFASLSAIREDVTAPARAATIGIAVVAVVATFLMALALYALVAMWMAKRRGEIGLRLALGATRGAVHRLIAASAARLLALGVVIGLALAGIVVIVERGFLGPSLQLELWYAILVTAWVAAPAAAAVAVPLIRATSVPPAAVLRTL